MRRDVDMAEGSPSAVQDPLAEFDASLRKGDAYSVCQFRHDRELQLFAPASSNTCLKPVLLPKTRLPSREAQSVFMR
jgi:hypothetical protein